MRLREPFVRKHIHAWQLVRQEAATSGKLVERKCRDCDEVQHALVSHENVVPDSVLACADADWYPGSLPTPPPDFYPHMWP